MKGISSIIAVILLLLVVIAIMGAVFVFFTRVSQVSAGGAEQQISQKNQQLYTAFRIEGVSGNKVYIRNTGTQTLTDVILFVNGILVACENCPPSLAPNEVGTYTLNNLQLSAISNPSTLRASSIGWSSEITTTSLSLSPDIAAPSISGIQVSLITANSALVSWTTDEPSMSLVKYGTSSGVYINEAVGAGGTSHSVSLSGLSPSTPYYFVVNSTDASGNSNQSNENSFVTSTASDTMPPDVYMISPANNSVVYGAITAEATASDTGSGVAGVQFKLDGNNLGPEGFAAPYSVSWNTMSAAEGPHNLTAVARDNAGNTNSSNVTVIVPSRNAYNFRNQTEIATATWQVFNTIYDGQNDCSVSSCYPGVMPKGWPADTSDSDVIANFSASAHIIRGADRPALLNWSNSTGQGLDLLDGIILAWIRNQLQIDIIPIVQEIVASYSGNPAYMGVNLGDEPYGYGLTPSQIDAVPARAKQVIDLFRQYDTNKTHRYYFNMASEIPVLRHCREASPDLMVSSGGAYLRNPATPLNGSLFQANYDSSVSAFDTDYLCTENWGIPFGYSLTTNNWAGRLNPAEARMITYMMLAHGGKFAMWFLYGTTYGLVWENNNPSHNSYFTYWSPAIEGGRNWADPSNMIISIDNNNAHSGQNSLKIQTTGTPADAGKTFYAAGVAGSLTDFLLYNYSTANYTLSFWRKSDCPNCWAYLNIQGGVTPLWRSYTCPASYGTPVGIHDWAKVSCNISIDYSQLYKVYVRLENPGPGLGSVWFDDISLYDINNSHEVFGDLNPGFEMLYGQDRKPHEPGYSAIKRLNLELKNLSREMMPLKKIEASDNYNIPNRSVIRSIDAALDNNMDKPRIEYGLLTNSETYGKIYLVLVNRVVVANATATVKISSNRTIAVVNVLTNSSIGTFTPNNGVVTFSAGLKEGDGIALRLDNILYNKEKEGNILYSQDFASGNLGDFIADSEYSVVDVSGNKMLFGNASSGAQNIWLKTYSFSDFTATGKFKIEKRTSSGMLFDFYFRQKYQTAPWSSCSIQVSPDPAQYQNGQVSLVCFYNSWKAYTQYDSKFLQDNNVHTFKINAYGNKLDVFIDNFKYNSGVFNDYIDRGFLGLRTEAGNEVYYDDIVVRELKPA